MVKIQNNNESYKEHLNDDFLIRHKVTDTQEKSDFHIHDAFEMMLVLSCNVVCAIGDKKYNVKPNSIILFNNMDLHHLTISETCQYDRYVLYFKPEYIEALSSRETDLLECFLYRPFADAQIITLDDSTAKEMIILLDKIVACQNAGDGVLYGQDLMKKILLGELLLTVNRIYREHHNISLNSINEGYGMIYSVINFIHKNLDDELSLDVLAQSAYISKQYLCSLFKNVTGLSPNQYIINCRIMKAKELLVGGMPVDTVCGLVGYKNLSHFSRIFKQNTGVSPKKYSMQNINNL